MSTEITDYAQLNEYAVLSSSAITNNLTVPSAVTITNGNYGTPNVGGITGDFVGTRDIANALSALGELNTLSGIIALKTGTVLTPSTITVSTTYTPGVYTSASGITFQGPIDITLDALDDPTAQFFFIAGSAITFNNIRSITLTRGASTCNIFWQAYSAITFTGTTPPIIPGIFIAGSEITFANASQVSGRLYVTGTATPYLISFAGASAFNVDGACTTNPQPIVCYAKGTLILTKKGFVPIENIKEGDKVVTKGKIYKNKFIKRDSNLEIEPVMWISKFKVKSLNSKSRPICIKKDALGKNYPFLDLYVSPNHSLLLNGKMIPAKYIVNDDTIYQDKECDNVEYYHLECEEHSAIIANGVLSESYLDLENRHVFENSIKLGPKVNLKKMYYYSM
jgi:hypothetical protein